MSLHLNPQAVKLAQQLIADGKFKNDSGHWGEHNPDAGAENKFLDQHEMAEYANWHLGIDTDMGEDAKGRYKFPFGDFKTVHRDGLIAAKERAAQQGYHEIETAADELLQTLEKQAAK
ncbi:hypothetical protein LRS06_21200 [Hymenobacter sp. J193]|uniref:hypothetical protein n=1 Tax=Hymenobacter sp. J193 TaxID=2898429 RepID=UPI0021508B50|nr:hypothetical protein [Hymenobacter sp. J193]MCR5886220.1 hypothetical protein [Hymenobacter sp. J193]MCR5890247.1 hypothetical protein [Hymenobacter sp. J193]